MNETLFDGLVDVALSSAVVLAVGLLTGLYVYGTELPEFMSGLAIVGVVEQGSPAEQAGLKSGDQIVAMDNMRVTRDFFNARMAEKKPGDLVNLTIFRFDDLSTLLVRLSDKRELSYRIVPLTAATALQKQVYRSWLGVEVTK